MPRPRQYNPEQVRQSIVDVFHRNGFAAASLSDLEDTTQLNRRQLYNDFGDKQVMFVQALRDFCQQAGKQFLSPLEHGDAGLKAIRHTLKALLGAAESPRGRLGCLVCNTAREPIAEDPLVGTLVRDYFKRIEIAYRRTLGIAKVNQELPADANLKQLARYFMGLHVGLCVLCRAGVPIATLRDIATEGMARVQ